MPIVNNVNIKLNNVLLAKFETLKVLKRYYKI